jgi:NADPH:quinone reductase-like Zn-dependent oxidoreductase
MKAVVCTAYGPPDVLQLQEVEKPAPRDNEVLIKIYATTVTAGDVILRSMNAFQRIVFGLFFGLGKNKILGHELSGEIEAVGKRVTRFEPGEPVFASAGSGGGAYAEYICLPEDGMVAPRPANLSYEEAAAVPIGGNTALHILRKGEIQSGQRVLIYGASGSVGTYAVQLARYFGAKVTGVCSTANLELVQSLGAEQVIDYTQGDFTQSGETYDVVFDAVRKVSASRCKAILKQGGAFLTVASPTSERAENLIFLRELVEAGEIRPVIDRRYPLEQIAEAHRYVDGGHKVGNIVITVRQDG